MCERGLRVGQLRRRVRVAVEREETARFEGAGGQRVIEVLSRRIAIDLDRDAALGRGCKYRVPVGDDARARSGDAAARVGQNADRRVRDRGQHAVGLVLVLAQPRMRRGQHQIEGGRLIGGQVQLAVGADVRFDAL